MENKVFVDNINDAKPLDEYFGMDDIKGDEKDLSISKIFLDSWMPLENEVRDFIAQIPQGCTATSSCVHDAGKTVKGLPKLIMQTWKTHEVPEKWRSSPLSISRFMPDWKYVLMSDEDNRRFVQEWFPHFLDTYDALDAPIKRADAIRYMWFYINGGVYIDLDIELKKSVEPLFDEGGELFFVRDGYPKKHLTNCFMASMPRHPLWINVLLKIMNPSKPKWYHTWGRRLLEHTGPWVIDHSVRKGKFPYTLISKNLVDVSPRCDGVAISPDEYITPLEGGSWIPSHRKRFNDFYVCNPSAVYFVIGAIIILLFFLLLIWFLENFERRKRR